MSEQAKSKIVAGSLRSARARTVANVIFIHRPAIRRLHLAGMSSMVPDQPMLGS